MGVKDIIVGAARKAGLVEDTPATDASVTPPKSPRVAEHPPIPRPSASSPAPVLPAVASPPVEAPPQPIRQTSAAEASIAFSSSDPAKVRDMGLSLIYQEAGIPPAAWGAEEAIDFLSEMPIEEPDASRRRSLIGFIRALKGTFPGLTPDKVAEDVRLKARALNQVIEERKARQAKFESDTQREIDALRVEIQKRLEDLDARSEISRRLREHAARLAKVEEFLRPVPPAGGAG